MTNKSKTHSFSKPGLAWLRNVLSANTNKGSEMMINYKGFKEFLMDRSSFLGEWIENDMVYSKSDLVYVAYEGEQSIIICSIDKKFITDDKHAFISLLQKIIVTDYYFPNETIKYDNIEELEKLYDSVIWEYIEDYSPIEFEIDEFLKKVKFDYNYCVKEYKSECSSSELVRNKLDLDVFNSRIESGIKLIGKWNEYEYFFETESKYLLYSWGTSA